MSSFINTVFNSIQKRINDGEDKASVLKDIKTAAFYGDIDDAEENFLIELLNPEKADIDSGSEGLSTKSGIITSFDEDDYDPDSMSYLDEYDEQEAEESGFLNFLKNNQE